MAWWKSKPDEATLSRRRTVMIVDDDMPLRKSTSRLLEKQGYVAITCVDGVDAIATYKDKKDEIGLILLDMKMPKMGGRETFDELRKLNPDARIVIASGYALDTDVRECLDNGAVGFISKPFGKNKLYALLEEHLADA